MDKDYLIERLTALCQRFDENPLNGRYEVARRAGLSEQYLYQVIAKKPMTNGNLRSLGTGARFKLNKAFPDWLDQPHDPTETRLLTRYQAADAATRMLIDMALANPDDPTPAGLSPSVKAMVDMARAALRSELAK